MDTSRKANDSAKEIKARHSEMVRDHLLSLWPQGATQYEIAAAVGLDHMAVNRRISDLRKEELVEDSGDRRPSPSGRDCAVWRLTTETETQEELF